MPSNSPGAHTLDEILSQPQVWETSLQHLQKLDASGTSAMAAYDRVIFTGCGSTFYLSRWGARVCEQATGVSSHAVPASDLLQFPGAWVHAGRKNLLVAISRSAETTETILALKRFKAGNLGDTVVVTCYPDRELAQLSGFTVDVPDAQEQSVAQTRSFSSMLLAVCWLIDRRMPGDAPGQLKRAGNALVDHYRGIAERIGRDASIQRFFYLGSGALYGLANEAMLKMKEMSLSYSEAFHTLEFRHGPMSMIDNASIVLGLLSAASPEYEYKLLREMHASGAHTLGFLEQDDRAIGDALDDRVLFRSGLPDLWQAPLYLPVLQLIAYERSISKGLDPDHPTNLTSVVVLHD